MRDDDAAFLEAFDRLPNGTFEADYDGRRWVATRSGFAGARAEKLVADAADGTDYISMNLYWLRRGVRLAPCEMPEAKVRAFVLGLRVRAGGARVP